MDGLSTNDLAKLPRWALVTFAARCARRLDREASIFLDKQAQLACNNAILVAERAATHARALDVDETVSAAVYARRKIFNEVINRGDETDYAQEFSAPAEAASLAAQTVREPDPHKVSLIINEVIYALGWEEVSSDILRDYRLLARTAVEQRWSDNTAVAPHFFAVAQNSVELVFQAVRCLSDKLSQLVSDDPNTLDVIEWRDLERMLASVFEGLGFNVELTPPSKDGGKDIVLKYWYQGQRREYIVEVKHWRSGKRVGKKELTHFVHVVARENRDGGLFLSTYGYSDNEVEVITEIERDEIFMGEKSHIVSLCRSYVRKNNGLWTLSDPLHEILHRDFRRLKVRKFN